MALLIFIALHQNEIIVLSNKMIACTIGIKYKLAKKLGFFNRQSREVQHKFYGKYIIHKLKKKLICLKFF